MVSNFNNFETIEMIPNLMDAIDEQVTSIIADF